MKTSKLVETLTPDLTINGVDTAVITAIASKVIAEYETRRFLGIQEEGNSGSKRTYYLLKRPSKKCGFIFQVRYIDPQTNAMLPTKYSTGTNDFEKANRWAVANRERCLASYEGKAELAILENYYLQGSKYLEYESYDGRFLSPDVMKQRQSFTNHHIIPFFQGKKVRYLSQITPLHIKELKHYLSVEKHLTPQTINYNLHSFKKCLELLRDMGKITTDFSLSSFTEKGSRAAEKRRNIYHIESLKGVFSKQWDNGLSRVLCMVIYFTGIRNSEILRMRFNDIQKIEDVLFLNVRGTKSRNAIRKVPIHPVLYSTLEGYVKENGIDKDMPIFTGVYNDIFRQASFDMGSLFGYTEKKLLEESICFYSGRHTYKTILAVGVDEKIGDVPINTQEMFMGHNFNKDELKKQGINEYAYRHTNADVIGDALLAKMGKEVLKILKHYYL
jgi:integrase